MRCLIDGRFNNDPSIDMLLLTTHVGGLGLNLTGADTVIFVEHDWNPMKDLQVRRQSQARCGSQSRGHDVTHHPLCHEGPAGKGLNNSGAVWVTVTWS